MDDLYISTADVESAVNVMNSTKECLSLGGFNLTKWNSNSDEFLKNVANENLLKPDLPSPQPQKVLGLPWNASTDEYIIEKMLFKRFPNDQFTTQRKLLKFVASFFDPLGVIAPLTIRVRKILQAIWNKGPQWDAPLDVQQFPDFLQFKNELPSYQNISIPRALFRRNTKIQSTALHTLTDASEYALSAVSYLRTEYIDKTVDVVFMMGKARVAPIKRMTIPNLELQAAVYGAQLAQFIKEQQDLETGNYFFWSDSTTVLHWLRTPEMRHRIFVANKLAKILDVSSSLNWRYIASSDNPADDGSRGYEVRQMNATSCWLSRPSFLRSEEKEWPCQDLLKHNPLVFSIQPMEAPKPSTEGCIIDITSFSNWNRLIRVTAYCFFFRDLCKKRSKHLALSHHTFAYRYLIQVSQIENFADEISALRKGKEISASSRLKDLCPYVDNNDQLRAKGRLSKAMVLETARHPIILDGLNPIVKLLIKNFHLTNTHSGVEQTRCLLMQYYWILKCRAVVRQTVRQCIPCRRMIQDIQQPQMSDIPCERLPSEHHFVFATTGLDFVGPFPVSQCGRHATRYVLLFTCLVVRAVHLEIAENLSTDSTMNCIRRFISRRGKPKKFLSDNGKSFVSSCSELKGIEALRASKEFASKLHILDIEIEWKFNPPLAPHFGGSWERLIQVFKLSLYKVIGSRTLTHETLSTFTCEIESNMNSRPLTYTSSDINDPLPLTPNHFLLGRPTVNFPPGVFSERKITISKSWRTSQHLAEHFWNRFLREYIPNQQKRSKWTKCCPNLQVGDLVWVLEDFTPRGLWSLAKVIEVYPSSDQIVRSVKLKTAFGEKIRPVVKLSKVLAD